MTLASDDPAVASLAIIDDWDESDRAKTNPIVGQAGVAAGAGAVGATVQRVTLASDDPGVAHLANVVTAVQIIDDWDESDRAKVNIIVGQAGIAAGAGAVGATVPRVTLASDDPGVAHLATIATAIAIIDDWDETDRAKVNIIAGQAGITAGAGGVGASTPRVTLASDDPAVASLAIIDDWDESDRAKCNIIVGQAGVAAGSGAVSATTQRVILATDDPAVASLAIIDDWDESDRAKTNPIVGQAGVAAGAGSVSATVQRMTLASDDPAVTALQLIDDWDNAASDGASVSGDVAHDTADAGEPVKVGTKSVATLSTQTLVAANDRSNAFSDLDGVVITRRNATLGDLTRGSATITDGSSTQVIAAAGSGVKTYITDVTISNTSATAVTVDIRDGTAGSVMWTFPVPANTSGVTHRFESPIAGTANTAVAADPSAAASSIIVCISGFKSKI
jgi:hypothetical protein